MLEPGAEGDARCQQGAAPSIVAGFFIVALGLIALGANAADFSDTGPSPQELERTRAVERAAETCMIERGYVLKEE